MYILRCFQISFHQMNTSDILFPLTTATYKNVNYPNMQKDTIIHISISNDVLFFTISRLTICRNSVVKYKYQPSKSLENALFSAFYLSRLFIVRIKIQPRNFDFVQCCLVLSYSKKPNKYNGFRLFSFCLALCSVLQK